MYSFSIAAVTNYHTLSGLCSFLKALGMDHFQVHSGCWQISVPCSCKTEVPAPLQAVYQWLSFSSGGPAFFVLWSLFSISKASNTGQVLKLQSSLIFLPVLSILHHFFCFEGLLWFPCDQDKSCNCEVGWLVILVPFTKSLHFSAWMSVCLNNQEMGNLGKQIEKSICLPQLGRH